MKLLLDENLPHKLREEIIGHDVHTAFYAKLCGVQNGELLRRASQQGFAAIITNDRGIEFEQNLSSLPLAVVVLLIESNTIETIRPLLPELHRALDALRPRTLVKIGVA